MKEKLAQLWIFTKAVLKYIFIIRKKFLNIKWNIKEKEERVILYLN